MFGLGMPELLVIGGITFLIFGPAKIPALASSVGKGIREFRKGIQGLEQDIKDVPPSVPAETSEAKP